MHLLLARRAAPLLLVPVVAAVLVAGVWLTGGVITNDFRLSIALTTVWFLVSGAVCVFLALRRRRLRVALLATYAVTATAVGGYLGVTTLRDDVVAEALVTGSAASGATLSPAANVEVARGAFESAEHATDGTAAVVRLPDGRRFLTLSAFRTSPGPDLRVRLVPAGSLDGGADGAVDLGALKGNRGNQQYRLPRDVAIEGASVLIWCRAFSAPFGSAALIINE